MVRDKNINAGYVVLNPGTASVFNCVHDAVNHNLSAEWIVAGHGDHADRNLFTTGRNALSIGTTAFGAGAVMRYIDFKGVERLAVGGTANILRKINPGWPTPSEWTHVRLPSSL